MISLGCSRSTARRVGYTPTPEGLAREMVYVLMNKIVFYKVLERYYRLQELEPLYEKGVAETCNRYLSKLRELLSSIVALSPRKWLSLWGLPYQSFICRYIASRACSV